MLELPETRTLARQITGALAGKRVAAVFGATHPHRFVWHAGDSADYPSLLAGRHVVSASGCGSFVDVVLEGDVHLAVSDGVNLRLHEADAGIPERYQLLLAFDDGRFLTLTVAMYGFLGAFRADWDNPYYRSARSKPSPLDTAFDAERFGRLLAGVKPNLSVKAFLATEQRIPGLGNGVLQDILFCAGIHPRRRLATLDDTLRQQLFATLKERLETMTAAGGRDTERDLFGRTGGYRTLLSRRTCADPCPVCGEEIRREAFLGGTVYWCPCCQPLPE